MGGRKVGPPAVVPAEDPREAGEFTIGAGEFEGTSVAWRRGGPPTSKGGTATPNIEVQALRGASFILIKQRIAGALGTSPDGLKVDDPKGWSSLSSESKTKLLEKLIPLMGTTWEEQEPSTPHPHAVAALVYAVFNGLRKLDDDGGRETVRSSSLVQRLTNLYDAAAKQDLTSALRGYGVILDAVVNVLSAKPSLNLVLFVDNSVCSGFADWLRSREADASDRTEKGRLATIRSAFGRD